MCAVSDALEPIAVEDFVPSIAHQRHFNVNRVFSADTDCANPLCLVNGRPVIDGSLSGIVLKGTLPRVPAGADHEIERHENLWPKPRKDGSAEGQSARDCAVAPGCLVLSKLSCEIDSQPHAVLSGNGHIPELLEENRKRKRVQPPAASMDSECEEQGILKRDEAECSASKKLNSRTIVNVPKSSEGRTDQVGDMPTMLTTPPDGQAMYCSKQSVAEAFPREASLPQPKCGLVPRARHCHLKPHRQQRQPAVKRLGGQQDQKLPVLFVHRRRRHDKSQATRGIQPGNILEIGPIIGKRKRVQPSSPRHLECEKDYGKVATSGKRSESELFPFAKKAKFRRLSITSVPSDPLPLVSAADSGPINLIEPFPIPLAKAQVERLSGSTAASTEVGPKALTTHLHRAAPSLPAAWSRQVGICKKVDQILYESLSDGEDDRRRHVFFDTSNVMIGFQHTYGREAEMDLDKLLSLLSLDKNGDRVAVGSVPQGRKYLERRDPVFKHLRDSGYMTEVFERNHRNKEQGVDEWLQAQIYRQRDHSGGMNCTFVLVTGDGNDNGGFSNFPELVRNFEKHSTLWVEVWAWRRSLSSELKKAGLCLGRRFRIFYLDDFKLRCSGSAASASNR